MKKLEYFTFNELIPEYDSKVSNWIGLFLSENYEHLGGKNIDKINNGIVNQTLVHSYKSLEDDLIITRKLKKIYPLNNPNDADIKLDEVILHASNKNFFEDFLNLLKQNYSDKTFG